MKNSKSTRDVDSMVVTILQSVRPALIAGVALLGAIACETARNPLEVESSSRIPAENVETPANAQLLMDGAIADFECAFASYAVESATVGEEFIYAQQTADRVPADARTTLPTDVGYSYLLLGESMCSLAFSKINADRSINYGGEISRDSTFKIAVARFTEAITAAQATSTTDILRMAYLGRARAKLNLKDYASAEADALQ